MFHVLSKYILFFFDCTRAMANPNMDTSFTRSLYIGRDKTAEVLKRKEAVEKELQARREAKIRDQNERMARIALQKEMEKRQRAQQIHQRELEKQKAVLDKRCVQLEKLNAKKAEILHRTHQNASRIAALNQHKKPAYVFGSSTPRELSYLETLKHQQRYGGLPPPTAASKTSRDSTPSSNTPQTVPTTARMPSRFLAPKIGSSPSTAMTRSVYGALGGGGGGGAGPSHYQAQKKKAPINQPIKQTPNALKRQRMAVGTSRTNNDGGENVAGMMVNNPTMTQSLYAQSSSRMGNSQAAKMPRITTPKAPIKKQPQTSAKIGQLNTPLNNKKLAPFQQNNKVMVVEQQKPKPVIRPKKAQQQGVNNTTEWTVPEQVKQKEETEIIVAKKEQQAEGEEEQIVPVKQEELEEWEEGGERDILQIDELLDENERNGKKGGEEGQKRDLFQFANEHIELLGSGQTEEDVNLIVEQARDEGGVGTDEKEQMAQLRKSAEADIYDVQMQQENSFESQMNKGEEGKTQNGIEQSPDENAGRRLAPSPPMSRKDGESPEMITPPKSTSPPIALPAATIILPDQEEREARRRRLNEILQRTRQEATTASNTTTNNGSSDRTNGTITPMTSQQKTVTSVANPMAVPPQKDASALAQDILAKHRHKFQKQQQQGDGNSSEAQKLVTPPTTTTLANELAESGFFSSDMNSHFYSSLPGQVQQQIPPQPLLPPASLTVIPSAEMGDKKQMTKTAQPEDPRINGHGAKFNGAGEFHPPEPNSPDITLDDD